MNLENDGTLFTMLVVGLEKCLRQPAPYPYPSELQHALNALSLCTVNYPKTFPDLLTLFETPVKDWWCAGQIPDNFDERLRLLYMDELTEAAEDYLETTDLRGMNLQHIMLHQDNIAFRNYFRQSRKAYDEASVEEQATIEAEYAKVREFLIRNPFTTPMILRQEFGRKWEGVDAYYVPVAPDSYAWTDKNAVWDCPACGSIASGRDGNGISVKPELCLNRCPTSQMWQATPLTSHLKVVKNGMLRRTVIPGRVELDLADRLRELQQQIPTLNPPRLYPGIDVYDIQVTFVNGRSWAVDVKDYHDAIALGWEIKRTPPRFEPNNNLYWDEFFYVVPDQREKTSPGYCERVRREANIRQSEVHVVTVSDLYNRAKKQAWSLT